MPITDEIIRQQAEDDKVYAERRVGRNYYDLSGSGQAAIQRAKQNRVVWIDADGAIKQERRK